MQTAASARPSLRQMGRLRVLRPSPALDRALRPAWVLRPEVPPLPDMPGALALLPVLDLHPAMARQPRRVRVVPPGLHLSLRLGRRSIRLLAPPRVLLLSQGFARRLMRVMAPHRVQAMRRALVQQSTRPMEAQRARLPLPGWGHSRPRPRLARRASGPRLALVLRPARALAALRAPRLALASVRPLRKAQALPMGNLLSLALGPGSTRRRVVLRVQVPLQALARPLRHRLAHQRVARRSLGLARPRLPVMDLRRVQVRRRDLRIRRHLAAPQVRLPSLASDRPLLRPRLTRRDWGLRLALARRSSREMGMRRALLPLPGLRRIRASLPLMDRLREVRHALVLARRLAPALDLAPALRAFRA